MDIVEKNFNKMNDRQKEAILHVDGPLLILAGAGSGKTTVLVNRIANLICRERACRPWQILAITFTNKAAGELKDRLSAMLGDEGMDVWASTFHSTCARILRRDGERLGFTRHFTIYDTDDSKRLMKDCLRALKIDEKSLPVRSVLNEISHAKDNLIGPKEYSDDAGPDSRLILIAQAYSLYQQRLKEADAMDFDDLIFHTVRLFQTAPDVLDYYRDRFRYILVDEYQDTNHAQYVFVRLLAEKSRNLCVVGDDDQSIYKFRGATIENIMSFEKTFPDAKVIRLEQNYRSTQNILDAANAVIAHNTQRKGKTLWTENPEGCKLEIHTSFNEMDEADFIAQKILDMAADGRKYSDFAVLYRMNTQSNMLERIFVRSGIPYRIIGGLRFYERKEIRDMLAYLSVISNPSDEIRLRRIINQPKRSIGEKTIAQAMEISQSVGESLFEVISHADEYEPIRRAAPKLRQFTDMIGELINAANDERVSLNDLYQLLLEKTKYIEALRAEDDNAQERIENINELSSNLVKYEEENPEGGLAGFLEEVSLFTDIDNYDSSSDSVTMMTIHSAKGLEFPVVFLPGMEEGIFPGMQSIYNPGEVEEERRLAYVAITRAREELFLTNADSRLLFGSTSRNKPSRFLKEIPEELTEHSRSRSWKKPEPGIELPTPAAEHRTASMNAAHQFGPAVIPGAGPTKETYRTGDRVLHRTYGEGIVLTATPMGNDTLLEIDFSGVHKKLMANYARLQKKS
ncbi:MAG TPA: UvrD-helicase domain-containing protein [Candidatus Gallacutalibacter pullicola]|uniref:DNA 3'-5' helicase n=1 Tax=Candidatus Gallacutalibacter pullicola TaxID=2840830 RepID=A0A9D1DPS8_9FIRM|nr:UvrD-helicase domain-containing protein [Candidatus Gallacutalibacter pullicola]